MDRDQAKLFVGGISRDTSEDTLKDHFDKYGAVMGSVVAKDKTTKNPRGFGFVWFSDPSSADKALIDTHVIGGRTVEVKKAIPRTEQSKNQQLSNGMSMSDNNSNQIRTRKIFVGGLPTDLTEEEFKNYFERFGRVTDVVVMHDSMTHRPRGFGFITYDLEDSVENVMQNSFHELNGRLVEVKRAVPKEENNWNGNGYYVRNGGGRGSSGNVYPVGNYSPYGPGYAPNHAPAPYFVYDGYGGFYNGSGVYNGWYPGFGYGVAPIANGYGRGNGVRAGLFPYGNTSVYPAYMNGDVSAIDLAAVAWPGVNVKVNQVFLGIGRSQRSIEGGKEEANPLSEAASSKQG